MIFFLFNLYLINYPVQKLLFLSVLKKEISLFKVLFTPLYIS